MSRRRPVPLPWAGGYQVSLRLVCPPYDSPFAPQPTPGFGAAFPTLTGLDWPWLALLAWARDPTIHLSIHPSVRARSGGQKPVSGDDTIGDGITAWGKANNKSHSDGCLAASGS